MYSRKELGRALKIQLEKPFDVVQLSRWAERIFSTYSRELSPDLDELTMILSSMEHGPEFEYTKEELSLIADNLMNEEENPFKGIK